VSGSGLFVGEDTLVGRDDEMTELSWREDWVGPFFIVSDGKVVSWWDDSYFVDSSQKFDNDFLWSVIVNDFELSDVAVLLHDS